ncbi:hypothetical protein AB0B15_10715 [Streptomyces sp. NPDC045456]|uniref:DUF7439 family protein n=1 Tax=Streptomyces sp. NPDC045456 TaxID=3155254 RepID=UPI0033F350DD
MSKMRVPGAVPVSLLNALPVRYRSRVGAALAALGVIVSILSVACADKPEVAVIIQIATALGVVAPAEDDVADEPEGE